MNYYLVIRCWKKMKDLEGCWVLGVGCWVLGVGFWVLGFGFWVLGFGYWKKIKD